MNLYYFVAGKMALWEEVEGNEWGQWSFIHDGYIYSVLGESNHVYKSPVSDREILKIYYSYDKTINFDLSEVMDFIPQKNDDETFYGFYKEGDKLVSVSVPKEMETKLEHLVDACFELVFSGEWDQDNLQNHIEKNNEE